RRRKLFFEPERKILAAYIASVSDIDDLIPCLTTLQIEWNKLHYCMAAAQVEEQLQALRRAPAAETTDERVAALMEQVRLACNLSTEDFAKLGQVWQDQQLLEVLHKATNYRLDLQITVLGAGLSDYRRSVQYWWGKTQAAAPVDLSQRPIYFVSSNAHSMINLLSGFAWEQQERIAEYVARHNPENLREEHQRLLTQEGIRDPIRSGQLRNFLYYTMRLCLDSQRQAVLAEREQTIGVTRISDPHCLDVEAQMIEMRHLQPNYLDPRLQTMDEADWQLLQQSDALIFNIDYPLGMAAYHIFSQVCTAVGRILGLYILGKAATLNGRVGDVMIPNVVYDEHSRNSYLFRNCFTAQDVAPYLKYDTVFDNQKALTVRGTILKNRNFMHVFYEEGYTDIEMEAGPYLSAIYEDVYPRRYPIDEIVNLFINAPYDIGVLHYASDTPISRRQSLLSKSLSYFGVDATYASSVAVLRQILQKEVERQRSLQ
ncbi:MAG: hypothetical protein KDE47_03805, partial [Caldilineaceae bacterium]|nr:hypothetical protein [Caldilineaceae bacterium]